MSTPAKKTDKVVPPQSPADKAGDKTLPPVISPAPAPEQKQPLDAPAAKPLPVKYEFIVGPCPIDHDKTMYQPGSILLLTMKEAAALPSWSIKRAK